METHIELTQSVDAFIREQLPDATDLSISPLRRLSTGYSRENWSFDLTWSRHGRTNQERLLLRRDPEASLLVTERRVEFDILKALEAAPHVLAPRARWLDADGRWFGRPAVIIDRIEKGRCDWLVLNGSLSLDARLSLAKKCIGLLAAVHQLDWKALGLQEVLPISDEGPVVQQVRNWYGFLEQFQLEPYPELEIAFQWLLDRRPKSTRHVLVHADYKPGNMLIEGTEIIALLDWEIAHIGDPAEDIGWITNPVRRREHQIEGHWITRNIVDEYARLTGTRITDAEVLYWNVFSNFKLSIIGVTGTNAFINGGRSRATWGPVELVETIFDLMRRHDATKP